MQLERAHQQLFCHQKRRSGAGNSPPRFREVMAATRAGSGRVVEAADTESVWSHQCSWEDLFVSTDVDAGRSGLDLGDGWTRRWAVSWRAGGDDASCSVHDLVQEPVLTSDPMRHFTWRRDQRHRPGRSS